MPDVGRALAFGPGETAEYLVGTEEGRILLCSTEFGSQALFTYEAHDSPVQAVQWNPFLSVGFIELVTPGSLVGLS